MLSSKTGDKHQDNREDHVHGGGEDGFKDGITHKIESRQSPVAY